MESDPIDPSFPETLVLLGLNGGWLVCLTGLRRCGSMESDPLELIKQDIAAKVLTHNIARAAACCAQQRVKKRYAHREHAYKINVSHGLSAMKHLLVKMVSRGQFEGLFEHYVALLLDTVCVVRPGRSFVRANAKMRKIRF